MTGEGIYLHAPSRCSILTILTSVVSTSYRGRKPCSISHGIELQDRLSINRFGAVESLFLTRPEPTSASIRFLYQVQKPLCFECVFKSRMELLAPGDRSQEAHKGRDERMFVSDVSGRPELFDVGVTWTSNKNLVTSLHSRVILQIEEGKAVHILHVECYGPLRANDLEAVLVAISGCKTCRFKSSEAMVRKPCHYHNCIVNAPFSANM